MDALILIDAAVSTSNQPRANVNKQPRLWLLLLALALCDQVVAEIPLQTAGAGELGGAEDASEKASESNRTPEKRSSIATTVLTFLNFGEEKTNTHHYEFHFRRKLSPANAIGIKFATWKLFAPMGIQFWDPLFLQESEFYPGRLQENGLGLTFQRLLWKDLFASIEVLPLYKTYMDARGDEIGTGFKLYTSYHLGYHIRLFNHRAYIEPQLHCNYWPIDTRSPDGFRELDRRWANHFLFEPNIYFGINF